MKRGLIARVRKNALALLTTQVGTRLFVLLLSAQLTRSVGADGLGRYLLVMTVEDQVPALQEQAPDIPPENFLLETMPRGTASVVGYAAAILDHKDPGSVMAVLTADHIIGNLKLFQQVLGAAYQAAGENYINMLGFTRI